MRNWLRQHAFAFDAACAHVRVSLFSFGLNVLVVAIALALPIAGLTILENVRPLSEQLAVEPEISIFLTMDVPQSDATALESSIRDILQENKKSAKIVFIPRQQALDALREKNGLSDVLTTLGENPLPDSYILKLESFKNATDAIRVDAIAAQLGQLPGVDKVQVDSSWVKRLAALLGILRMALLFLAGTLGVVVIAVVFNTIRLQVMTHLDEIEVSRMIGATDAFIRRPFYYTGALLGLSAGAIALAVVALALQPLNTAIAEFAHLYASEFQLAALNVKSTALLLALSALLGLVGAFLSVRRHLARLA